MRAVRTHSTNSTDSSGSVNSPADGWFDSEPRHTHLIHSKLHDDEQLDERAAALILTSLRQSPPVAPPLRNAPGSPDLRPAPKLQPPPAATATPTPVAAPVSQLFPAAPPHASKHAPDVQCAIAAQPPQQPLPLPPPPPLSRLFLPVPLLSSSAPASFLTCQWSPLPLALPVPLTLPPHRVGGDSSFAGRAPAPCIPLVPLFLAHRQQQQLQQQQLQQKLFSCVSAGPSSGRQTRADSGASTSASASGALPHTQPAQQSTECALCCVLYYYYYYYYYVQYSTVQDRISTAAVQTPLPLR